MDLTQVFPGLPDAASGLVHVGHGRWVDPAWGRPLQPNPAGGPPTMPQALNRYAATPLGQPGVYAAVAASEWYDVFPISCCQLLDIGVDLGALITGKKLGVEPYLASRTAQIISTGNGLPHFARNLNAQGGVLIKQGVYSPVSPHASVSTNANRMRWLQRHMGQGTLGLSEPGRWNKLMNREFTPLLGKPFTAAEFLEGGGVGFFFDAGWQAAQDWDNPYLTGGQKFWRAGVSGVVGFVAGIGVAAVVGTGPVGFVVALGVGWFIEAPISNMIFESVGLIPTRNLRPLNNN